MILALRTPPAAAPAGPSHAHRCDRCGTSWRHSCAMAGDAGAHTCPGCGALQWRRSGPNIGDVAALIVGARAPRQLAGLGAAGDDEEPSAAAAVLDRITGGKVTEISGKLDAVELLLKVSAGAALFAAVATLIALRRR